MAGKLFILTVAALLAALVATCVLVAAPWLPRGGLPYLAAVPWVLISTSLVPLAVGHILAFTRTPVCRYGYACPDGRAFYWLFTAMLVVAGGALIVIAVAGIGGLNGRAAGSLLLCASMCGAMQTVTVPGFCFDWFPLAPANGGGESGERALWVLHPGGYKLRGLIGSSADHRVFKGWVVWGLAMAVAYIPVGAVAILPFLLGGTLRATDPAPRQALGDIVFGITAVLSLFAPLAAGKFLQRPPSQPAPAARSNIAGATLANGARLLSIGGAAVALLSSFFYWMPCWAGFIGLLLSFAASEAGFLTSVSASRPDMRGIDLPVAGNGRSGE